MEKVFSQKNHRNNSIKKICLSRFFCENILHPSLIFLILRTVYERYFWSIIRMIFLDISYESFFFFWKGLYEENEFSRTLYLSLPDIIRFYSIDTIYTSSKSASNQSLDKFFTLTRFIWIGSFEEEHKI